ncbi:MAG: HD domain-containing protein [Patescibacteria group bacterium]
MNDRIESYLKEKILPDLENSRGGFDKYHTLEVVDWIKQIINHNPQLKLDKPVLIIAAYAHDWGYAGVFKDSEVIDNDKIESAKKLHMEVGAEKIKKLLKDNIFSFLTNKQKERCIHLVAVHDKKYEIEDTDEIILMEADMLSTLDIDTTKPVIDAESNKAVMDSILNIRLPKFKTDFSRNEAKKLIQRREEYFKNLKS